MGSEDFAFFVQEKPGARFMYGATKPGEQPTKAHNPSFMVDENAFPVPTRILAQYVLESE